MNVLFLLTKELNMNIFLYKSKIFVVVMLLFSGVTFSQTVGDYRSAGSGNWIALSSWQYYNGTTWVTPSGTTPQGYPGQFTVTGTVLIQTSHTITLSAAITTVSFGTLTITGILNLNGDNSPGGIDFTLVTQSIIVTPSAGFIGFNQKANLRMPANASLQVKSGGLDDFNPCTANQIIYIGVNAYAKCNGGGSLPDFTEVMTYGGTLNVTPTSNSPVCQNSSINLSGSYSGIAGNTTSPASIAGVNYSWSVVAPDASTLTSSSQNYSFTANLNGNYFATLTSTTYFGAALFTNSKTITIIVNPVIGTNTISAAQTICSGIPAGLTGTTPTGGNSVYTYLWESSSTSAISGFGTATGTSTGINYTPAYLTQTTWYRRSVISAPCANHVSTAVQIIVNPAPTTSNAGSDQTSSATCGLTSVTLAGNTPTIGIGVWSIISGTGGAVTTPASATSTFAGTAGSTYTLRWTISNNPCIASMDDVVITFNQNKVWNGSISEDWNTAANWTPSGIPTSSNCVTIPSAIKSPIISGTNFVAYANTLTILDEGILKVQPSNTITVTDFVDVDLTGGTLIFENTASLVQINNVITNNNKGYIDYQRTTSARPTDYTYWSSPVSPFTLGELYTGTYYSYEATASGEDWKQEFSVTDMTAGKGYIANRGAAIPLPGLPPTPGLLVVTFTGLPNNGHYEINTIISDRSYLLGNPYPSALDADEFLTDNAGVLDGTLYFWTHNTALNLAGTISNPQLGWAYTYSLDDYASYNITGGVGTSATSDLNHSVAGVDKKPSGKIGSGQGFFASSKVGIPANSKIIFDNSMRVGVNGITGDNSQFFKTKNTKVKTTNTIEKNRIWLNLTNTQGAFKQTLIGYITDATNEYDSRFDGESFDANEFVDFYSVNQDKNLVIQGRVLPFDQTDEVQLGFRTTINGAFTINIDQVDGLLTNEAVFIQDKLTNTIFDLKSGNYTFNTVAGTFNDRFVLQYSNKTLGTNNFDSLENKVLVSNANKQIKINSFAETIDKVVIYDLLGRQIYQKIKVNSNEFSIANLLSSHQVLVVKTLLQNGKTFTDKIIY